MRLSPTVILLLFIQRTLAYLATSEIQRERRIVGGELARIEQVPHLVNIRLNRYFHCGGSLVTPRCVLTAAHCIGHNSPNDFVVRGGNTRLSDVENRRTVEQVFVPPEYNNRTFEHDVAIMRLHTKLQGVNIKPIAIGDFALAQGEYVTVSGWGLTREHAVLPPNHMHTVRLRVLEQAQCKAFYDDYRNVSDTMFCASVPGEKDACLADSGGPAVARGRLVGVVSWGKGRECGRADSPGVYVRLNMVKKWIMSVLYKHC
ncbi:trypsin alpha-3 [Bactrocera dorsalis]|uniref:Trypsin alpha-3 n=1 Tax=Bactrocera dorsalis TaxID=27457 RepID=A0A6I9VEV4_BACDO|nr:trypsin alpha-3 [Bactrocera dorsalis]